MEKIKKGYAELFQSANISQGYRLNKEKVYFNDLSHFVGMKGIKYDQQTTRLLIVGRAVNGWEQLNSNSAELFSLGAVKKFENNNFQWIVCDNGSLRNNESDNGKYYWLNDSPFWRISRKIWTNITNNHEFEDKEQDRWVDYIAWTNLYKIAPKLTGNPTSTMAKKQLEACKNILKAEIEVLKPTHILFVCGYDWWFENFKSIFDVGFSDVCRNKYRSNEKNNCFVETSAVTSEETKIVVACRPEFRDENLYVDDIVNKLKQM